MYLSYITVIRDNIFDLIKICPVKGLSKHSLATLRILAWAHPLVLQATQILSQQLFDSSRSGARLIILDLLSYFKITLNNEVQAISLRVTLLEDVLTSDKLHPMHVF